MDARLRTALIGLAVGFELGLKVSALVDLARPERRVRGGNKVLWVPVIAAVNLFGPLGYLLFGIEPARRSPSDSAR